jgi:amidase
VDLERFPRKNVHFPTASANQLNAWAWKCSIQDKSAQGLLKGKTVAIKDNVTVKDVPMLMGTDFVKGYVPVKSSSALLQ